MKKRLLNILILLFSIITLNSCVISTTGESLGAFSKRMNELNEGYNMTSDGYIINTDKSTFTKFYRFSQNEIMLNFKYDKKNRLNEMNIVFESIILSETPEALSFIKDCIKCFIQNEKKEKEILNETDFENTIKKINIKTISAEADNIKMEIDTTNLGTVVTIYKDI